ncbi:MAG: hypothetical protein Q7S08_02960, partial [bacterium]|nr:hypothetical protein [bacterium]
MEHKVAKRKKSKSRDSRENGPSRKGWFSFPESVQRWGTGILFLVLSLVLLFAFFEKAGIGGKLFYEAIGMLYGKAVFLFPLFFGLGALTLF